jgi:hypothetical protein
MLGVAAGGAVAALAAASGFSGRLGAGESAGGLCGADCWRSAALHEHSAPSSPNPADTEKRQA